MLMMTFDDDDDNTVDDVFHDMMPTCSLKKSCCTYCNILCNGQIKISCVPCTV